MALVPGTRDFTLLFSLHPFFYSSIKVFQEKRKNHKPSPRYRLHIWIVDESSSSEHTNECGNKHNVNSAHLLETKQRLVDVCRNSQVGLFNQDIMLQYE